MKMTKLLWGLGLLFLWNAWSCAPSRDTFSEGTDEQVMSDDGIIEFTFFHINDVYEIAPLEDGKKGGMARVATLFKKAKRENPNTIFVHAGDFLNPSLLGTLKYEGKSIKGRQMVEVMNACGVDVVTLDNHEFDLKPDELQARINESRFDWLATNVLTFEGEKRIPFRRQTSPPEWLPETWSRTLTDEDGTQIRVGIFGATVPSNPKDWVYYEDFYAEAVKCYLELNPRHDLVFGLTHLNMVEDLKLASMLPNVPLLMGGHDHDHIIDTVGNVCIAKADANAKTVYLHHVRYNKNTGEVKLRSELVPVTDQIPEDPEVAAIVEKWMRIQDENLAQIVDKPYEVVGHSEVPLDGREKSIRNFQTNLGELICKGFAHAARVRRADAAIMNGGSVRIDDQLSGDILAVDFFRAMPFGGQVWEMDIRGSDLMTALNQGLENKGTGGYLQWYNIEYDPVKKSWKIGGKPLARDKTYHLCLNDYLAAHSETIAPVFKKAGVKFYKPDPADKDDPRSDVRKAVISFLKGE